MRAVCGASPGKSRPTSWGRWSRTAYVATLGIGIAAPHVAGPALAQGAASTQGGSSAVPIAPGTVSTPPPIGPVQPLPSQEGGPTTAQGVPTLTVPPNPEDARIDALRLRGIVAQPSVADTALDNYGGWRSSLANIGVGFSGIISGQFAGDLLGLPTTTRGSQRYVGQGSEVDSSNSFLALTYDLGRIGLKNGLAQVQVCETASSAATYPHNIRVCAAYIDQPFLNNMFDIQVGILANNYQFANPFVGGSVASGSLGPSSNLITEFGLSVSGEGAPGANFTVNLGPWYNRFGIQRSTSPNGYIYDAQVGDPYGIRFNDVNSRALIINEAGYRVLSAPGVKNTWVRVAGVRNFSSFTSYSNRKETVQAAGVYLLADHQFTQPDPSRPRRGLYAGFSYMYGTPAAFTYSQYFEARVYGIGLLASRPQDQLTFVANRTDASDPYLQYEASLPARYQLHKSLYNFTVGYTARLARGIYLNNGLTYSVHPSVIYTPQEGNPLLFKSVLVFYL